MGLAAPWHVGLPGRGIEPVSPASASGFSTIVPQGKPYWFLTVGYLCSQTYIGGTSSSNFLDHRIGILKISNTGKIVMLMVAVFGSKFQATHRRSGKQKMLTNPVSL